MSEKKPIDWERIERDYRAGVLSVREISRQASCSEALIRRKAKALGWQRDLSAAVRQEARAQTARELGAPKVPTRDPVADREIVKNAAALQVEVVRQHRQALGRGMDLLRRLFDELDGTTMHIGEIEALIEAEPGNEPADVKRRQAMLQAVSLAARAGTIKDLSATAKNLIPLERQAFAIDAPAKENEPGNEAAEAAALIAKWQALDPLEKARRVAGWVAGAVKQAQGAQAKPADPPGNEPIQQETST